MVFHSFHCSVITSRIDPLLSVQVADVRNPVDGVRDAVVDPGLPSRRTGVAGRHHTCNRIKSLVFFRVLFAVCLTDQVPSAALLVHQRAAAVALARVLASVSVPSTHHFRVDDDVDAVRPMPPLAHPGTDISLSQLLFRRIHLELYLFSMTGTSTACSVFGRNRDPGFSAPQPAAHPNFPRKSSFFSGRQIGAETRKIPLS